jgi:hypothetical protein
LLFFHTFFLCSLQALLRQKDALLQSTTSQGSNASDLDYVFSFCCCIVPRLLENVINTIFRIFRLHEEMCPLLLRQSRIIIFSLPNKLATQCDMLCYAQFFRCCYISVLGKLGKYYVYPQSNDPRTTTL